MASTVPLKAPRDVDRAAASAHPRTMGELMSFAQSAKDLGALVDVFAAMITDLGFTSHFCVEIDEDGRPAPLFGDTDSIPEWRGARRPGRRNDFVLRVQSWHGRETWLCLGGRDVALDVATRAKIQGWAEVYASFATALLERARDIPTGAGLGLAQRQCLAQLLLGRRDDEVADMLGLTPLAVRGHVEGAMAFLGVDSRAEAIALAARRGWLAGLEWHDLGVRAPASNFRG